MLLHKTYNKRVGRAIKDEVAKGGTYWVAEITDYCNNSGDGGNLLSADCASHALSTIYLLIQIFKDVCE